MYTEHTVFNHFVQNVFDTVFEKWNTILRVSLFNVDFL